MSSFVHIDPGIDGYWRAIILFGRNVASYKFALGKTLLELAARGDTEPKLEDLAPAFAGHVCVHIKDNDKQGTSPSSRFLDACREHVRRELTPDELLEATVRLGFVNVIDAFHVVPQGAVGEGFFHDARKKGNRIILTDAMIKLATSTDAASLGREVESRWRLVETAWNVGIAPPLLSVDWDENDDTLFVQTDRRVNVTSARDALNGYQRGRCFYCFSPISAAPGSPLLGDVDHFFLRHLKAMLGDAAHLDGVWNLVLSCQSCNRGVGGKLGQVVSRQYLEQLERRNNYLIDSHHPLRETLMSQTGSGPAERRRFLQEIDRRAVELMGVTDQGRWATLPDRAPRL